MAIKHVKNYYKQIEKMYLELVSELHEMEEDFKKNECTEEELQNLLVPVRGIEENYKRLAYILYLLYQPNRDKKSGKYHKENKDLYKYFKDNNLTAEQEIQKEEHALKQKQKDAGERRKKTIEQERLKTEYNKSVL